MRRTVPPPAVPLALTPCWAVIPDELKASRGLHWHEPTLQLTQGYWTVISPEDVTLESFCWGASVVSRTPLEIVYAYRSIPALIAGGKQKHKSIHSEIMGQPYIDHRDQHILAQFRLLDNRRGNLRVVTQSENHANKRKRAGWTSSFKGVSWAKTRGKWFACICNNSRNINLGCFATEAEAAAAYNSAHDAIYPNIPEGRNVL